MTEPDRTQRDRMITYDYFFNPDQTLKELGERYDLAPYQISNIISKHFKSVNEALVSDMKERNKFHQLVLEKRRIA